MNFGKIFNFIKWLMILSNNVEKGHMLSSDPFPALQGCALGLDHLRPRAEGVLTDSVPSCGSVFPCFRLTACSSVLLQPVCHMAPGRFHCSLSSVGRDRVLHSVAQEGCMQANHPASDAGRDPPATGTKTHHGSPLSVSPAWECAGWHGAVHADSNPQPQWTAAFQSPLPATGNQCPHLPNTLLEKLL